MRYSIVIPFHNEELNVTPMYERLTNVMQAIGQPYELILVDDGSNDGTQVLIRDIAAFDTHVTGIRLRRNFGQTAGLSAGFDRASGDIIIAMDGDQQHRPEDIPRFIEKIEEGGYDVVSGWRQHRRDGFLRTFPSLIANGLMAKASDVPLHDFGTTFKAYRREVLERIPLYGQMHRFIPALAHIEGASICEVPIEDSPRGGGKSHYGLARTGRVLFDILTIRFLLRYMARPLYFFGKIGVAMIVMSGMIATWLLAKKLVWHEDIFIKNGPLLLFSAVTFLGGMQFLGLGFIGDLFARLYYAPKHRMTYNIARIYRSDVANETKPLLSKRNPI